MRRFCFTAIAWTAPGTIIFLGMWIGLLKIDESRDNLGLKRLKPIKCNSMIFGTSRSAQGVNPAILQELAPQAGDWLNFSFNLSVSPWNEAYADAIIQKVDCSIDPSESGHFLIFVDPWVLDENCGRAAKSWLSADWLEICDVNLLSYAINNTNPLDVIGFGSGADFLSVFCSSIPRQLLALLPEQDFVVSRGVQPNGWLPNPGSLSPQEKQQAIEEKISYFKQTKTPATTWPGESNSHQLSRLIRHLKGRFPESQIKLIRPPVSNEMLLLEQEWFPEMNKWVDRFALQHNLEFVDFNQAWKEKKNLDFNDAHHLSIDGASRFSAVLAETCLVSTQ